MQIVAATPHDAEALSRVAIQGYTENFGHMYSPKNLAYHMEKTCSPAYFRKALAEGDQILLAKDGDTIMGYVKVGPLGLPVEPEDGAAELHRLYVLSPYQGKAVGKALMNTAMALPVLSNATAIYISVWEENYRAQGFYKAYGFAPFGKYLYMVGTHADNELIFRREAA